MIKQLALVIVLVLAVAGSVFVVQRATQLNSQAFSIFDFISSFHAASGDANFNPDLDINGDGVINTLDLLRDRYAQEATNSGGITPDEGELNNIIDYSNQVPDPIPESTDSGEFDPDHI